MSDCNIVLNMPPYKSEALYSKLRAFAADINAVLHVRLNRIAHCILLLVLGNNEGLHKKHMVTAIKILEKLDKDVGENGTDQISSVTTI